jgi:hypothetical protein
MERWEIERRACNALPLEPAAVGVGDLGEPGQAENALEDPSESPHYLAPFVSLPRLGGRPGWTSTAVAGVCSRGIIDESGSESTSVDWVGGLGLVMTSRRRGHAPGPATGLEKAARALQRANPGLARR